MFGVKTRRDVNIDSVRISIDQRGNGVPPLTSRDEIGCNALDQATERPFIRSKSLTRIGASLDRWELYNTPLANCQMQDTLLKR